MVKATSKIYDAGWVQVWLPALVLTPPAGDGVEVLSRSTADHWGV